MSTGRSIHAVPSITPSPREGIEDGPRLRVPRAPRSSPCIGLKPLRRDRLGFPPLTRKAQKAALGHRRPAERPSCECQRPGGSSDVDPLPAARRPVVALVATAWPADGDGATMFHRPGEVTAWLAVRAIVDFVQASEQVHGQDCSCQLVLGSAAVAAACFFILWLRRRRSRSLIRGLFQDYFAESFAAEELGRRVRASSAGALRAEVSSSPRPSQPSSSP